MQRRAGRDAQAHRAANPRACVTRIDERPGLVGRESPWRPERFRSRRSRFRQAQNIAAANLVDAGKAGRATEVIGAAEIGGKPRRIDSASDTIMCQQARIGRGAENMLVRMPEAGQIAERRSKEMMMTFGVGQTSEVTSPMGVDQHAAARGRDKRGVRRGKVVEWRRGAACEQRADDDSVGPGNQARLRCCEQHCAWRDLVCFPV
uniref:hypothetical protein n=1 Tax=uncultured Sphingomonas sp. TaxID=158754 RepID=UPI0035CB688E